MRKVTLTIILVCLMALVCAPAFSLGPSASLESGFSNSFKLSATDKYEPYSDDEFPKWALTFRRAECIFFGGIPITLPVTILATGLAGADLDFLQNLGIACAVSATIALLDYILGVINEN